MNNTVKIGILSDTHLSRPEADFSKRIKHCFNDCQMILHAGDLTSATVLSAFGDKEVHAVHGNMCDASSYHNLPAEKIIKVNGFTICLTHGHTAGYNQDIENFLISHFNVPDCIIYGHTHRAVCRQVGPVLMINPGSFSATGRYGAAGTYAILKIGKTLHGEILHVRTKQ